jgi:Domain of unknown function (DUF1772)
MFSLSAVVIPTLIHTTSQAQALFTAWNTLYVYSNMMMRPLTMSTSLLYGYAAWSKSSANRPWHTSAAAGAMTFAIVPFTFTIMAPAYRRLLAEKLATTATREDAVHRVRRWRLLHTVRTLLPATGAVLGMLGLLGKEVF